MRKKVNKHLRRILSFCRSKKGVLKNFRSRQMVFCKKGVLRNFAKFAWKHLCQCLFLEKFLRTPFLQNTSGGCFWDFAVFTGKHLCWSLFAGFQVWNFIKKRHQHLCFPVNTAKHLRTPILKNISERLLLILWKRIDTSSSKQFLNQLQSMGFQFCKLTCLQRKIQRKTNARWKTVPPPGRDLLSACHRRVKSVPAGRVEISS